MNCENMLNLLDYKLQLINKFLLINTTDAKYLTISRLKELLKELKKFKVKLILVSEKSFVHMELL